MNLWKKYDRNQTDRPDIQAERETGIKVERAERNYIRKELIKQLINGEGKAEKEKITSKGVT